MRIAFVSTRGIPNNYGGFEQFAEYVSVGLAEWGLAPNITCLWHESSRKIIFTWLLRAIWCRRSMDAGR